MWQWPRPVRNGLQSMLGLLASSIVVRNVQTVPALGLRFYGGDHEGFVLAATWSNHSYERSYDSPYSFDRTVSQSGHPSLSGWNGDDSIPGPFQRRGWNIFDLALGAGFQF